jgi:peptide deformylase
MAGNVRPITLIGEPVLHRPLREVTEFDDALRELADDMFASMYAANGVGLAANQIGVDLRIFVYDCMDDHDQQHKGVIVNPTLEFPDAKNRHLEEDQEGCLSVPGIFADVTRSDSIDVRFLDRDGQPQQLQVDGLLAVCIQHEMDHLEGKLFVDYLSPLKREMVRKKLAKQRKLAGDAA